MIRPSLTRAENQAFAIIRAELLTCGRAPSYAEIRDQLGLASTSGVARLIVSLVDKGYIVHSGRARSIALAPGAETYTVHLPPDLDARLGAHVAAWASTPEAVITKAVSEYLARRP